MENGGHILGRRKRRNGGEEGDGIDVREERDKRRHGNEKHEARGHRTQRRPHQQSTMQRAHQHVSIT